MHNLSGVIIPTDRYEHIYAKGVYSIPSVVVLYDDSIDRDTTRTEFHQVEGKNEAKRNDSAATKRRTRRAKTSLWKFLTRRGTRSSKNRTHSIQTSRPSNSLTTLPSFVWVSILSMRSTYHNKANADGILQFINAMEVAQRNSKHTKLKIQDKYIHAVALKLLLKSGYYETETREWSKLPNNQQTWTAWKTMFR